MIAGTLSLYLDGEWSDAPRGSYAVIPGGVLHDFENRGAEACGFIGINGPGGFEEELPDIAKWFAGHPPGDVAELPVGTSASRHK